MTPSSALVVYLTVGLLILTRLGRDGRDAALTVVAWPVGLAVRQAHAHQRKARR